MSKNDRKPLNELARATYHEATQDTDKYGGLSVRIPVPSDTVRVMPVVMGEAYAAGAQLEVLGDRKVAVVKLGGARADFVGVWAWGE